MLMDTIPAFLALQTSQRDFLEKVTVGNILESVAIILISWFLVRLSSRFFNLISGKIPRSRFITKLLEPVARIGIWFLAIFAIIGMCFFVHFETSRRIEEISDA